MEQGGTRYGKGRKGGEGEANERNDFPLNYTKLVTTVK
jgi:hypothetical protein